MLVQIDVKKLLTELKQYNPEADLTGVKAYLFDLVVDDVDEMPEVPRARMREPIIEEEVEEPVRQAIQPDDDILERMTQTPPPPIQSRASKHVVKNGPPKKVEMNSKEAREARRKRAEDFANMSGKDILDNLVNRDMEKKRGEHNQFISEGGEAPEDDGELEIG